jgi:hypothetical protein
MHRIWKLPALAAAALLATAALAADAEPFKLLSVEEVSGLVGKPGVTIFDANTPETYAKGHVPGAVFLLKPIAAQLPADRTTKLVFYCKNPK